MGIPSRAKLSQWEALMMEALRAMGWTDEELLRRVRQGGGELPADESDFHFDYQELSAFAAEQPEVFEAAVRDGYAIKYNTIRGIRSWISIVFGKQPDMVLEEGSESATVALTVDEKERLSAVLSFGWSVSEEKGVPASGTAASAEQSAPPAKEAAAAVYRIEPIQR